MTPFVDNDAQRLAFVGGDGARLVAAYLPGNYTAHACEGGVGIVGRDVAGWTLDDYVLPRLRSGLIFGVEVKTLPERVAA